MLIHSSDADYSLKQRWLDAAGLHSERDAAAAAIRASAGDEMRSAPGRSDDLANPPTSIICASLHDEWIRRDRRRAAVEAFGPRIIGPSGSGGGCIGPPKIAVDEYRGSPATRAHSGR